MAVSRPPRLCLAQPLAGRLARRTLLLGLLLLDRLVLALVEGRQLRRLLQRGLRAVGQRQGRRWAAIGAGCDVDRALDVVIGADGGRHALADHVILGTRQALVVAAQAGLLGHLLVI